MLPVSATPATSMQTASPCTSASLWGEQTRQAGRFAEHARRPPCVIMRPGSQGHAANRHMHSGNNPQSSSMEFQRAGGRRINGRNKGHEREQQPPGSTGVGGENNPQPPPTALAGCDILYTSRDGSSFRLQLLEAPLGTMLSLTALPVAEMSENRSQVQLERVEVDGGTLPCSAQFFNMWFHVCHVTADVT